MNEAGYWLALCGTRVTAGAPSLAVDPWCRRLLSEVAGPDHVITQMDEYRPAPLGKDGSIWRFADGSALLASSDAVIVR